MFNSKKADSLTLKSQVKNVIKATKLTIKDVFTKIKQKVKAGEHNLQYDLPVELLIRIDVYYIKHALDRLNYQYYHNERQKYIHIWW